MVLGFCCWSQICPLSATFAHEDTTRADCSSWTHRVQSCLHSESSMMSHCHSDMIMHTFPSIPTVNHHSVSWAIAIYNRWEVPHDGRFELLFHKYVYIDFLNYVLSTRLANFNWFFFLPLHLSVCLQCYMNVFSSFALITSFVILIFQLFWLP